MAPRLAPGVPKRVAVLFLILVGLAGVLWLRLGYLQIVRHSFFEAEAMKQRYRSHQLVPDRGAILDRHGTPLAVTVYGYGVYAVPAAVEDPQHAARLLSELLGRPADVLAGQLARDAQSVWLSHRVEPDAAAAIDNLKLPGVYVVVRPQRGYPHGWMAADVLGYTGLDNQGLAGLEWLLEKELAGVPGEHFSERDPRGRAIAGSRSQVRQAEPGHDVVLTLDAVLQYIAEQEVAQGVQAAGAEWGLAIVMNPKTGEILAMAVQPGFDPANWEAHLPRAHRNPAVADQFEPGSTMKVFTVAAALEEGVATPETTLPAPAVMPIGGGVVRNHNSINYGSLSVAEALVVSSNTALAHLGAEMLGGATLAEYLRAFGFGQRLGVDMPGEGTGRVPTPGRVAGGRLQWATVSFGQGVAVTPLQLAAATAALANGGTLMKPFIVQEIRRPDGYILEHRLPAAIRQVVSPETAAAVVEAMEAVVQRGTGRRAQVPGYRVAGKTGTAQVPEDGGYGDKRLASFVGFAPAEDPALLVLVMLYDVKQDTAEGGRWAAPVFAEIMRRGLQHLGIPPSS